MVGYRRRRCGINLKRAASAVAMFALEDVRQRMHTARDLAARIGKAEDSARQSCLIWLRTIESDLNIHAALERSLDCGLHDCRFRRAVVQHYRQPVVWRAELVQDAYLIVRAFDRRQLRSRDHDYVLSEIEHSQCRVVNGDRSEERRVG